MTDYDEIIAVAVRYATALDARDWNLLSTCFISDARAHYEGQEEAIGYPEIEARCRSALDPLDASQHIVTNFVIELDGDSAGLTFYIQAHNILHDCPGGSLFTVAGSHRDRVQRTDSGWRLSHIQFSLTWTAGNPEVLAHYYH